MEERFKKVEVMEEKEVAVDAIPLATKPPSIVDWKIVKEGKISYYQIIRADGSSKRMELELMLLGINLLQLGKVNAARHKLTDARESINLLLLLKVNAARHNLQLLVNVNDVEVKTVNGEQQLQALVDAKKIVVTEASVRRDLQLDDEEGTDCLPNATIFEELTRMRRPKKKDTQVPQSSVPSDPTNIADEAVNEEPSMQLKELMDLCTKLQQRVLDLENTKTAQAQEITSLKKRVKKLEKKGGSRTHKLKRLYKVGRSARVVSSDEASLGDQEDASKHGRKIDDIDVDAEITLVDETQGRHDDDLMFDMSDLAGEEVFVAEQGVPDSKKDDVVKLILLLQQLVLPVQFQLVLLQQLINITKLDEEVAQRLQAEFDEQERIKREKAEATIALKETWDDIQAKIEANQLLAKRLQTREQELPLICQLKNG
ncbi:hypothetical protein Tco_0777130 [Tanacetum coccineum]